MKEDLEPLDFCGAIEEISKERDENVRVNHVVIPLHFKYRHNIIETAVQREVDPKRSFKMGSEAMIYTVKKIEEDLDFG